MPDKPWKAEERHVARLLGGHRYPANSGGRVDVEGTSVVAQVKHVQRLSLAQLEALALDMADLGRERGKVGLVVVKRRAGRGQAAPRRGYLYGTTGMTKALAYAKKARVGRPGDVQTGLVREGISKDGRTVRLSVDCGGYHGARPYYTVAYLHQDGRRPQVVRYTPFRDRAEWLFERFCQDSIDPAELVKAADSQPSVGGVR